MNLEDLIKLAGLQKDNTPAVEPVEVEQQVAETPFNGRDNMKAIIALVNPEQLNQLVGDAPIEEEGFANSGDEYAGEPEEYKGTLGSPADLSLRRYLGANGEHVTVDETKVYEDHKVEDISEAYFNYKLDEAPKSAWLNRPNNPNSLELPRDIELPPGVKLPPMPMPDPRDPGLPDPMPMPDPRDPGLPDPMPMPYPMPEPGPPNDPTPFPDPMPEPGPPNDPTPFPGPPNDPTPFPDPEPKDPPGEPIPEPKPEPGPKPPTPGGGPEEPPKDPGFDPDPDFPDEPEEPKDPINTKIDPKDLDGDSPADPKDPNWDLKMDALGRNIQTAKERDEIFAKYGFSPPRDVLKAQRAREQDRRDRTNKVGFDKLYNDRDEDTLNSTYVSQRDENGNIIDPNPKESTMNEEPNEGNEFTGALANAKKAGKKEFKVDGKTYQVEAVEQLHADMNRMRKLSGLTESTIMERPGLENKRGYDPFGSQEPETRLKNQRGFDPFGSQEPPKSLQGKRGFDPFGGAPGDEGDEPEDPMGGMGEPSGEPAPRVPDAIGPTPTPPKSDPEFDPFGGAPGDEGDDPEDPMGGMGEPGGPANPPAGTRPPDAIGPKPTPPASGTRPPDAIGPTPTPPASGTRPPDAIGPKDPATPGDKAGVTAKPKAPEITAQMRKDAEAYADREGLPLDQLDYLVPGTVGGIPTTLEVDKFGTVRDMQTGDVIGGDEAEAAREAAKGRSRGLGAKPEAPATPGDRAGVTAKSDSGEQKLPNGMTVGEAKRLAKLAGYSDEQIAAYEKRAKEAGLIK